MAAVEGFGPSRVTHVRAEDLLHEPGVYLTRLANWLGVSSDPRAIEAMKHPERSPYASLAPMNLVGDGDSEFQRSPRLRPFTVRSYSRVPPEWNLEHGLIANTNDISCVLGYGSII